MDSLDLFTQSISKELFRTMNKDLTIIGAAIWIAIIIYLIRWIT